MDKYLHPLIALLNEMSPYLLIGFLIAGILHEFVPRKIYHEKLSHNSIKSVLWAALFGIPLPLCSCGVIPTSASLRREGASKGATVSFLISTPQTGVDSILATASLMGTPFAIIRPLAAFVTAIIGGCITNWLCKDEAHIKDTAGNKTRKKLWKKCTGSLYYGFIEMMQDIGKWIVLGLLIAGIITIVVPDDFFTGLSNNPFLNMIVILALSIPMYLCATGSIPIATALMLKGLSPGAAFILLMAGPATNMAAIMVIDKVMGRKTLLIYLLTIVTGAICSSLVIDNLLPEEWFTLTTSSQLATCCSHETTPWWQTASSIIFVTLLIIAFILKKRKKKQINVKEQKEFKIDGMMCNHCKANVENGIAKIPGVTAVEVDLSTGIAYIEGKDYNSSEVIETIKSLGYKYIE
jgi:uncharacterized membrane protein YraQ (UPF0718 family)/copper chaperone CopZ